MDYTVTITKASDENYVIAEILESFAKLTEHLEATNPEYAAFCNEQEHKNNFVALVDKTIPIYLEYVENALLMLKDMAIADTNKLK